MLSSDCVFKKPYAKEIFGEEQSSYYAYSRETLKNEPIFPYFVFDGGAFHFANDRLGTTNSDELLELTMSGKLFDIFKRHGQFNWETSFSYTKDTDFTKKYEWQIWPQRLYMTLPVAQAFLRTGDTKYADCWLKIVKAWDEAHPYQEFDASIPYIKTDMVWRDMQVAWRALSLMHGLFMLQEAPYSPEEWKYLYDFIELHIKHLYLESMDRLSRNHAQNHVLQIGVALIMAGAMFPEFDGHERYIEIGKDTVKMNMEGAIFPDGGSNEDSPSYSHFIVRLYLEAYLLLKNNRLPPIEGLEESIQKQYNWLYMMTDPNGRVLRLSDSYSMDSYADIERARKLISLPLPVERQSVHFPDSKVAVLRNDSMLLVVDAMNELGGHRHYGRPQTLLFYDNEPILVDSGCCNYDIWDMYLYLRTAEAHNVVYSPDFDENHWRIIPDIPHFDPVNRKIVVTNHVAYQDRGYHWERSIQCEENRVIIQDYAESEHDLNWVAKFHLARRDINVLRERGEIQQLTDRFLVRFYFDRPFDVGYAPVMNDNNKIDYSRCVTVKSFGWNFSLRTIIEFEKR